MRATGHHRFFFNDTATTEIYTLSLHDALPIYRLNEAINALEGREGNGRRARSYSARTGNGRRTRGGVTGVGRDRKSTRLNSSHDQISYAVFCLKKKKTTPIDSKRTHVPRMCSA